MVFVRVIKQKRMVYEEKLSLVYSLFISQSLIDSLVARCDVTTEETCYQETFQKF